MRALPLDPRTTTALVLTSVTGLLAFTWPLLVDPGTGLAHGTDAPLVLGLVLAGVVAVVMASLSEGGLDVKAVALLGLLSAVGAVVRPLSGGTAGVEGVFALVVLGGRAFGPGFGFALGSGVLFSSALLTGGVGPWLPFQVLGAAWVGLGAGLLPRCRGRVELALLAAYGVVASLAYGALLNMSFWPFRLGGGTELSFLAGDPVLDNLARFAAFTLATSLGWDLGRAVSTAVLVLVLGRPVLAALRRAGARARFADAEPRPARAPGEVR